MVVVEYKFQIGQKVKTPFGELAIIDQLGSDGGENHYYVKTVKKDVSKMLTTATLTGF